MIVGLAAVVVVVGAAVVAAAVSVHCTRSNSVVQ